MFALRIVFLISMILLGLGVHDVMCGRKPCDPKKIGNKDILCRVNELMTYLRKRMDQIKFCQIQYGAKTNITLPQHCKFGLEFTRKKEKKTVPAYKIQYNEAEPYSSNDTRTFLEKMMHSCCMNKSEIIRTNEDPDFIYPVLGDINDEMAHGYYFIPLLAPPGGFYITKKDKFTLSDLVGKCLDMWPILVVCVFLSAIAGFIAWLLETWKNNDEFPRPFLRGWLEGIWWSFISMTTVGYGDIAPKSIAARLFSIIWILAGIITFSILTGELTTVILQANTQQIHNMADKKVGVLSERIYDKSLVVRNGGKPITGTGEGEDDQIRWLIGQLSHGNLSGILLDKNTFWKTSADMQRKSKKARGRLFTFFLEETMTTDIAHSGGALSYGILVKDRMKHWFFGSALRSQSMFLQNTIASSLLSESTPDEPHMFTKMFDDNYKFLCIALLVVLFLGILLEALRNRKKIGRVRNSLLGRSQQDESSGGITESSGKSTSDTGFIKNI